MTMDKEVKVILAVAGISAVLLFSTGCEMYLKGGTIPVDEYKQEMKMVDRPHGFQCLWKDCRQSSNESQGS